MAWLILAKQYSRTISGIPQPRGGFFRNVASTPPQRHRRRTVKRVKPALIGVLQLI